VFLKSASFKVSQWNSETSVVFRSHPSQQLSRLKAVLSKRSLPPVVPAAGAAAGCAARRPKMLMMISV